jgi:predicted negative regulator of RcsB-dependent stress response
VSKRKNRETAHSESGNADIVVMAERFWNRNRNAVIISLAVLTIALVGYFSYAHVQNQRREEARTAYVEAVSREDAADVIAGLTQVYEESSVREYSALSALKIGEKFLAEQDYDSAEEWLERVLDKTSYILLTALARENIAAVYEARGEYDAAMDIYRSLVQDETTFRVNSVRMKMAYLEMSRGNMERVQHYCRSILDDSAASQDVQKRAEALYAEVNALYSAETAE